jgi:uncharacterized protein (PEP-CTERM system associated)
MRLPSEAPDGSSPRQRRGSRPLAPADSGFRPSGETGWHRRILARTGRGASLLAAPMLAVLPAAVLAQDALPRAWTVEPRVSASATYTDNVRLSAVDTRNELIGEVAPGVRVRAGSASLQAYLDYELRGLAYRDDSSPSTTQNRLNTFGRLEAIDDRLFLDFSAAVDQQTVSAFGLQGQGSASVNPNRTEVRSFGVSPQLTGKLGGVLAYDLRYSARTTRSDAIAGLNNNDTDQWSALLGGATPFSRLAWSVAGSAQRVRYPDDRRRSESDRVSGRLTLQPAATYRVWVTGGRESNNFAALDRQSNSTHGAGFEWIPGPRTRLLAARERRFFGDDDTLAFSHRSGRAVWQLDHTRSATAPSDQFATSAVGTVFDLVDAQLTAQFPDPAERAVEVERFLAVTGLPRDATVTAGFLSSRIQLQKASRISLLLAGRRNAITLAATHSESESLESGLLGDDFDTFSRIRQTGFSVTWAYRLSPLSALSVTGARQRSFGVRPSAATETTGLRTLQAALQTRIGRRTTAGVTARRTESEAVANPYVENAAALTIAQRF